MTAGGWKQIRFNAPIIFDYKHGGIRLYNGNSLKLFSNGFNLIVLLTRHVVSVVEIGHVEQTPSGFLTIVYVLERKINKYKFHSPT